MHAEVPPSEPSAVRWVIPEADLPCGRLVSASGPLGDLLRRPIREAVVEPHGLTVWLVEGCSWQEWGTPVQDALATGLEAVHAWGVLPDPDDVLARIVTDVLAGPTGDHVRSHGGSVRLVRARDDEVEVELAGACTHCSAVGTTLRDRVEAAVRVRYPALRGVTDIGGGRPVGESMRFLQWPRRRRL